MSTFSGSGRARSDRDAGGLARVPVDFGDLSSEDDDVGPGSSRVKVGAPPGKSLDKIQPSHGWDVDGGASDSDSDLDREAKTKIDGDVSVIAAELRASLREKRKRNIGYMNLCQYLFFCLFYMLVVYIQSDALNAFNVLSSVRDAVVPMDTDGRPLTKMGSPVDILNWLVGTAYPVWIDEVCGDGVCNEPFEFPAYGRFGCRSDCGPNTNLTTVLIQVRADFRDDLYSPRALMSAVTWNLCRRDEEAKKAGFPDICWWEEDRKFTKIKENHLETVNVPPDTLWFIAIKGDYMGRVVGNIFLTERDDLPWVGTMPEWKACKRNVIGSRRNIESRRRLLAVDGTESETFDMNAESLKTQMSTHKRIAEPGEGQRLLEEAMKHARTPQPRGFEKSDIANDRVAVASDVEETVDEVFDTMKQVDARDRQRRGLLGMNAVRFDGVNAGVISQGELNWAISEELTFEAWVRPETSGRMQTLAFVGTGDSPSWGIMLMCPAGDGIGCCGSHKLNSVAFFVPGTSSNEACERMPSSDKGLELDVWSHIAVIVSETNMNVTFVINGVYAGHNDTNVIIPDNSNGPFTLGCMKLESNCPSQGCGCFVGMMDDVRVWNKAVNVPYIQRWMMRMDNTHPDYSNLQAHYDFNTHLVNEEGHTEVAGELVFTSWSALMHSKDRHGWSLKFDRNEHSIATTSGDGIQPVILAGKLTFEAWIKPTSIDVSQAIAALGTDGWQVLLMCGGPGLGCCGDHVNGSIGFWMDSECKSTPSSKVGVQENEWSHIAVVVDVHQRQVSFYVNGEDAGSTPHASKIIIKDDTSNGSFSLGGIASCGGTSGSQCLGYSGLMDGVRLWNTTRSIVDIREDRFFVASYHMSDYAEASLILAYDATNATVEALQDGSATGADANLVNVKFAFDSPRSGLLTNFYSQRDESNASISFDGLTAYGHVPYTSDLEFDDELTFEAWIKANDNKTGTIAAMDENGWGVFKLCSQGSHGIESGCCQGRTHNSIAFFPGQSTSTDGICSSAFSTEDAILIGQWTHILVTVKSGSYVHMYIDNKLQRLSDATGLITDPAYSRPIFRTRGENATTGNGLFIGALPSCGSTCMMLNATLDKIRIWNAAVDKDTIANNYAYLPASVNPNYEHIVADFEVKGKHDGIVENLAGMAQDMHLLGAASLDYENFAMVDHPVHGSALYFDGHRMFMEVRDREPGWFNSDNMTFEAWIKPNDISRGEILAMKDTWGWSVMLMCSGTEGENCCVDGDHLQDSIAFHPFDGQGPCSEYPSSTLPVQRGVWNHVAVTTEKLSGGGLTVKFFVDGMAAGKFSSFDYTVSGTGSHNGTITFGRIPDKSSACEGGSCMQYIGHMDNVRLWSMTLGGDTLAHYKDVRLGQLHPYWLALVFGYDFDIGAAGNGIAVDISQKFNAKIEFTGEEQDLIQGQTTHWHADELNVGEDFFPSLPRSMYFDGKSVYGVDFHPELAPPESMTWEAWIQPDKIGIDEHRAEVLTSLGDPHMGWGVMLMCGKGATSPGCCENGDHIKDSVAFFAGENDGDCKDYPSSTGHVNRGDWNHVAITVSHIGNGKQITFYINGTKSGSYFSDAYRIGDGGGENTDEDVMLGFGGLSSCEMIESEEESCASYRGYMDNLRLWNASLGQVAIMTNMFDYIHEDNIYLPYLIAEYLFDGGSSNSVGDKHDLNVPLFEWHTALSTSETRELKTGIPAESADAAALFSGSIMYTGPYTDALSQLKTSNFTLEAWIRPDVGIEGQMIAMLGDFGWGVMLTCNGTGNGCCSGSAHMDNTIALVTDASCMDFPTSDAAVRRNEWNHIAIVVTPSSKHVDFFINGTAAGSHTGDFTIEDGNQTGIFIGGTPECQLTSHTCMMYSGLMDNVHIWSTALTPKAIRVVMNHEIPEDDNIISSLIASYAFDGHSEDTAGEHHLNRTGINIQHLWPFSIDENRELGPKKTTNPTSDALYFDGVETLVSVPFSENLVQSSMTFEVWIKPDEKARGGLIASMGIGGWGVMLMCNYDASYADNAGCCEGGNHIENSIGFFAYGNSDTDCVSVPSSSLAVEPGEWNHVAITFAAPFSRSNPRKTDPELCFYVNGEQAGCSSDPGYIVSKGAESSDFTIGGYDDSSCGSGSCAGPGSRYKGYMDNLRIWKAPIDAKSIALYMQRDAESKHPYFDVLVADFNFWPDASDHTKLDDKTGQFHATVTAGAFFDPEEDQYLWNPRYTDLVGLPKQGPSAMYFNGVDQYVKVPNSAKLAFDNFLTFEAWIKPMSPTPYSEPIVTFGDLCWSVYLLCGGEGHMCCGNHTDGSIGVLSHNGDDANTCANAPSSTQAVKYQEWNHIAVTLDNEFKNITFYVNGEFAGNQVSWDASICSLTSTSRGDLVLGNFEACPDCSPFLGYMDEIRIYKTIVNVDALDLFRTIPVSAAHPNWNELVAYYRFSHGNSSTVYDSSPAGGLDGAIHSGVPVEYLVWRSDHDQVSAPGLPAPPPSPPFPPPQQGPSSLYFNGRDTYIKVDRSDYGDSLTPHGAITFEAWIRPDMEVRAQTIAMLGDLGWGVMLMCGKGQGVGCCGNHLESSLGFWTANIFPNAGACASIPSSNKTVTRGAWSHIAVVAETKPFNENSVTFYINGIVAGRTIGSSVSVNDGIGDFYIGGLGERCPLCVMYKGHIDEVKYYTAALTAEEIVFLKDFAAADWHPEIANLALYYKFDSASGDAVIERRNPSAPPLSGEIVSSDADHVIWDTELLKDALDAPAPPPMPPPPVSPPPGQTVDASLYFNGHDTRVMIPFHAELVPQDFLTFDAWIKPDMDVKGEVIAMMGTWGWGIMLMCPGGTGKGCCGTHVTNSIGFWSENVTSPRACERQPSSTRGVTRGTWNHITVAVNNSNEVHFYIDGTHAGSQTQNDLTKIAINMGSLRRDLKIGGGPCPDGCLNYKGYIDEVSIFNDLWSKEYIWDRRGMRLDPSLPNAIAAYTFTRTEYKANGTNIQELYGRQGFDGVLLSSDLPQFVWSNDDYVSLTQIPPPPPSPPPFYDERYRGPSSLYFDGVDVSALIREQQNDPLEFNFSGGDTFFADEPSGYMTFEAWIMPERVDKYQFIASVGVSGSDDVSNWGIAIMCGRGRGPGCCGDPEYTDGSIGFVATKSSTELLACSLAYSSNSSFPDSDKLQSNTWQHIAVVVDAHATPENTRPELLVRSVHFYIGGKPAGSYTTEKYERIHFPMSKDYNKVGYNDKSGLHLGHGFCGRYFSSAFTGKTEKNHCWHFKGHIDELKLWKTAMSTTNVETHHLNPVLSWHPDLSHLMYYFRFDHGSGVNIVPKNYTVGQHVQSRGTNMILYPEKKLELIWDNKTHHPALPEGSIYAPPPPPPSPPPPPPQEGKAVMSFNGYDTLLATSFDSALAPSDYITFQAWIYPKEINRAQVIAMMGIDGWAVMLTCPEGSGAGCCGTEDTHASGSLMFWTSPFPGEDNCEVAPTSTKQVKLRQWQHVAVVADVYGGTVSFYIDGESAGMSYVHINKEAWEFTTEESKEANSGLHIGQSGRCKCLQYKGFIDEISVWNAAISPADIRLHWKTEPVEWHTNFDDIIAYWKFNTAHRLPSGNITSEYAVEGSGDKKINITIVESSDQDQTLFFNKTQMMGIPIPTYFPPSPLAPSPPPLPPPSPPPQLGPSAIYFNGKDTQVKFNFSSNTDEMINHFAPQDAFTFEAWVKPSTIDKLQFIAAIDNYGWGISLMCNHGVGCCDKHQPGALSFWTHEGPDPSNCENSISSNRGLTVNKWQHIAVVVSIRPTETDDAGWTHKLPSSVKFYIDGEPAGWKETLPAQPQKDQIRILNGTDYKLSKPSAMYFGRFGTCQCMMYKGFLDEVRMWHASLAGETIKSFKDLGLVNWHPNFEDVLAYYKFDRSYGSVVYDRSALRNDPYNVTEDAGYQGVITSTDAEYSMWNNSTNVNVPDSAPSPPSPPPPGMTASDGASLYFNGEDSMGVVEYHPAMTPEEVFTFEAWIRPENLDRYQQIVGISNDGWAIDLTCNLPSNNATDYQNTMCTNHSDGTIIFYQGHESVGCDAVLASNFTVMKNAWNHIAVTIVRGESVKFYINGTSAGTYTISPGAEGTRVVTNDCLAMSNGTKYIDPRVGELHSYLTFGGYHGKCADDKIRCLFFTGHIDEVRFWEAELARKDIKFFMNYGVVSWHPNAGHIIAYYKFDRGYEIVAHEYFHTRGFDVELRTNRTDQIWDTDTSVAAPAIDSPASPPPPPMPSPPPPEPSLPPAPPPKPRGMYEPRENEGNTAIYFDGSASYGEIHSTPRLTSFASTQALTVEAWIKPDTSGDEFARLQTIAMLGNLGWGVQLMCPHGSGFGCCGDHKMRAVGFFMDSKPNELTCKDTMSSDVGVDLNRWTHIAVVVNPRGWVEKFYYDVEAIAPSPPPPSPPPAAAISSASPAVAAPISAAAVAAPISAPISACARGRIRRLRVHVRREDSCGY